MEKKENKALAIILLILVVLLGSVVWGLIYSFGWFISIISYGIAFLAITLYGKFAKLTRPVYIITAIAIVVLNIIASFISISISLLIIEPELGFGGAFSLVLSNFNLIAVDFIIDSILSAAFTILGILSYYKITQQKKEKLENKAVVENVETSGDQPTVEQKTDTTAKEKDLKQEENKTKS